MGRGTAHLPALRAYRRTGVTVRAALHALDCPLANVPAPEQTAPDKSKEQE